jgi:small-conductance mechanosensitive channel
MDLKGFIEITIKGMLILALLNIVYAIIFKRIKWKSALLVNILRRVRLYVYILINITCLWWFSNFFPLYGYAPQMLNLFELMLIVLSGIIAIEAVSALLFDYFLPIVKREETLPIYRQLLTGAFYCVLVFLVFGWVFRINVAHILTTSAIISIVIGLALQDTLGNLFSGLAQNFSRSYQVGDWVRLGDYEGKVIRIDWRSVTILNVDDNIVIFPHSTLAKRELLNYSNPTPVHLRTLVISAHFRHSPHKIKLALGEILQTTQCVLKDPAPRVRLVDYSDHAVKYKIVYWIDDFPQNAAIASEIMEKVWYKFKREGIQIPFPIREVYHLKPDREISIEERVALLKNIDFIENLSYDELEYLASRLKIQSYCDGELIFEQGEDGDSFYLVKDGEVLVTAVNERGERYLERVMKPGSFFGEISLLTGDRRSATITAINDVELFTMGKEDFRYILKSNPKVDEIISSALAKRQKASMAQKARLDETCSEECEETSEHEMRSLTDQFLKKIRYFFSY